MFRVNLDFEILRARFRLVSKRIYNEFLKDNIHRFTDLRNLPQFKICFAGF